MAPGEPDRLLRLPRGRPGESAPPEPPGRGCSGAGAGELAPREPYGTGSPGAGAGEAPARGDDIPPPASKAKPLMDAKVQHGDPKKELHDVRSFIGACNFYRCHIKIFTYTSAILTDLIKKSTTWRWGP